MKIAVYSPNWIGDSVLALPFIRCLRASYPNAEIYIFCKEWVSGIYENNPNISNIFFFKNEVLKSFKGTIKAGFKIRKIKLDQFYTLTDSFRSALVLGISGSSKTIGYKSQMRSILLTNSINTPNSKIHRSKKYLGLLDNSKESNKIPYIHITQEEKKWGIEEIEKMGMKNPVGLFPFSVSDQRTIPNDGIIRWLQNSRNEYLIFGSKNDIQKGKSLLSSLKKLSIKSICGNYTLRKSIILISLCKFTLAADSGLGHISAALGVPTISFFGSGSPQVTGPIGDKIEIIKHCFPCKGEVCKNYGEGVICIQKISKIDIEDAVKKLMII